MSSDEECHYAELSPLVNGDLDKRTKSRNPYRVWKSYRTEKQINRFYDKQRDLLLDHAQDKNCLTLTGKHSVENKSAQATRKHKYESILGVVIWVTVHAIEHRDPYLYPRGRSKLEPLAVVIVGIIMGAANIIVIVIAIQNIIHITVELGISGQEDTTYPNPNSLYYQIDPDISVPTIVLLVSASAIKAILLFFCLKLDTTNAKVLAADQRNDIITNLVALGCALIGHYLWIYADPIGAIIVCTYIAVSWFYMAAGQIPLLSGRTADPQLINRIIRICVEHDNRIKLLDTVLVYHYGERLLCEVHVVLDENMSVKDSHNIIEPLGKKLESLDYVERAFIHCDYEADGFT